MIYELFTDRARIAMQLANQEAQRMNHEYVGTEHLLVGLIKNGSGTAAEVLANLGANCTDMLGAVRKLLQDGPDMVRMGILPKTPRCKTAVEHAREEARALNHNYIGTEHLLLGLLRDREGIAAHVLADAKISLDAARSETVRLLSQGHSDRGAEENPKFERFAIQVLHTEAVTGGLSLRQFFAGQAIMGAALAIDPQTGDSIQRQAVNAVRLADALIAELRKEK